MCKALLSLLTQREQSQHVTLILREWHWLIFRVSKDFKIPLMTYIVGEHIGEKAIVSPSKPRYPMKGLHFAHKYRLES